MRMVAFGSVELDAEAYEDWQKSLIYEQSQFQDQMSEAARHRKQEASKLQEEVIAKVEEGPEAIQGYIVEGVLGLRELDAARVSVPALPNALTAGEMSKLPKFAELQVADALGEAIPPAMAAEPVVWALSHAVWMGSRMFGADLPAVFLLGGAKSNSSEAQVRNFLRRTGGLRPVRGNTSPLRDCPISAACWRVRLAREAEAHADGRLPFDSAHDLLRVADVWENLVTMSLRQVVAVCSPRARAAVLVVLSRLPDRAERPSRDQVQAVIRALGGLSHSHSLSATPLEVLVAVATEALRSP